jgi:N-acetylneuraminic acid mutarotase
MTLFVGTAHVASAASWSEAGSSGAGGPNHTTTLLQTGLVLVTGGGSSAGSSVCRLYDPALGTWTVTASLLEARSEHTATLLRDGRVLVAGGLGSGGKLASVEIFDPATQTWSPATPMSHARSLHTANLLHDGRVLVTAGIGVSTWEASAEIYDPVADTWTTTGSLATSRYNHTATLLQNGTVLVVAGCNASIATGALASAELFDPATGVWSPAGSLATRRTEHAAVMRADGRVIVAGGLYEDGSLTHWARTAEMYDPATGLWSSAGLMTAARAGASASLLPNGKVLVAGGITTDRSFLTSAELYSGSSWSATASMSAGREFHGATPLPNGKILVTGGWGGTGYPSSLGSAELFDSSSPSWSSTGSMSVARSAHTSTLLPNGEILAVGGPSSERYDPVAGTWGAVASLGVSRSLHTTTLMRSGVILLAGGTDGSSTLASAMTYDIASNVWTPAAEMGSPRQEHTATLLPCGRVLVAGGFDGTEPVATAEVFDPVTGSWEAVGSLGTPRRQHTATLLSDGRVLVAGGLGPAGALASSEIFDPTTGAWTATAGSLYVARYGHTATLLPSGYVLVVGGFGSSAIDRAERFRPDTGTWLFGGYMNTARWRHAATSLLDGRVLVTGGNDGFATIDSPEVYDSVSLPFPAPQGGTWTALPNGASARERHSAVLASDGRVLVSGGENGTALSSARRYSLNIGTTGRPVIATATSPLAQGMPLSLTGTLFTGVSEAVGGANPNGSAANYPLVQLQRLDSGHVQWLAPDPAVGWMDTSFDSVALDDILPGPSRVTVFANGVASSSHIIETECGSPTLATPASQTACAGASVALSTTATGLCPAFRWRRNGVDLVEGGHFVGTTTATLTVSPADVSDEGDYDVVATAACSSTTATSGVATLTVTTQAPVFDLAVETVTHSSVSLIWTPVGASTYDIYRSESPGGPGEMVGSSAEGAFTDDSVASDTTYYYSVVAHGDCVALPSDEVSAHTLPAAEIALTVESLAAGSGQVNVTPAPPGGSCANSPGSSVSCQYVFAMNTTITVVPMPAAGSLFVGWGPTGPCAGMASAACAFTLSQETSLTVTFATLPRPRGLRIEGGHLP